METIKEKTQRARPSVYAYHDYRSFLRDLIKYRSLENPSLSMRALALSAGMSIANLSLILKGSRSFSDETINRFLPILELSASEESYFKIIWAISDAKSPDTRRKAIERLQTFGNYKKIHPNETEVFRYLTKWYYVAIRELAARHDFKFEPEWIQKRLAFPVLLSDISRAVQFLLDQGLVAKNADGTASLPNRQLSCEDGVYQLALAEYYKQALSLASSSIDSIAQDKRFILGHVFTIGAEDIRSLEKILRQTISEIIKLESAAKNPETVYSVTLAGVPWSQDEKLTDDKK
jgi:uncharacterized protein (TIGR02147 family)